MLLLSIASKIRNPQNGMDELCNWCIAFLEELSNALGISYGELNVWLFVIIQPALILFFMSTTLYFFRQYKKSKKSN